MAEIALVSAEQAVCSPDPSASQKTYFLRRLRDFCFLTRSLKYLKTNIRMADERLTVLRLSEICSISLGTDKFLCRAISCNPLQKSFSSDTLVVRPNKLTVRLTTAVFMQC
jgi:hypothetical protein